MRIGPVEEDGDILNSVYRKEPRSLMGPTLNNVEVSIIGLWLQKVSEVAVHSAFDGRSWSLVDQ